MKIAVEFDGTIVDSFGVQVPGAEKALTLMRRAGHILILSSTRANLAYRDNWMANPLWALGIVPFDHARWEIERPIYQARFEEMLEYVDKRLRGVFHMIDYGNQGKVVADLYIDAKALRLGGGWSAVRWSVIQDVYGDG